MKKRKNYPTSMKELEDIFYKNDDVNFEKRIKYLDSLTTDYTSPERERLAKQMVNSNMNIERVKEQKGIKTPDYVIISEKMYIEVKGIDLPTQRNNRYIIKVSELIQKINNKIDEILEKDKLEHSEYHIGGIVFFCILLANHTKMDENVIKVLIKNSKFKDSDIDFLLITHDPYSDTSGTSLGPDLIFVKDVNIIPKLQKIFLNIKIVQL